MLVTLCIIAGLILALVPNILWFVGWIGCRIAGVCLPYRYFGIAALVILVIFWATLAYGYFIGRWKIESKAIEYAHKDIPLTLSGHTHSAQIKFFGWTPAKWTFKEIAGRYDNGDQTLYINVGLGCTAPFRLGVNPEVTVITLRTL